MSMVSRTTVGGGTFEDVVKGKQNYVAQKECLIDLRNYEDIDRVKQNLVEHCDEILTRLEQESLRTVERFYIGKTLITRRRKPRGKGFVKFDPMDPNTWKKNGISSRWGTHKNEEYGRDGMIVLTAITREALLNRHQGGLHQEQYALALEQMLQHYYKLKKKDSRFANNTFTSGGSDRGKSIAYAVYVAFRLSDNEEETSMEEDSNPEILASDAHNISGVISSVNTTSFPSQTSAVSQQPNITFMSETPFYPTKVSCNKRPQTEPHPPGTKRRCESSSQDANMSNTSSSTNWQYSTQQVTDALDTRQQYRYTSNHTPQTIQDDLLTDQQFENPSPFISKTPSPITLQPQLGEQKLVKVLDLLLEKVRAMKEASNGFQQNPDPFESQDFILVCQDGSPNRETSYEHRNIHLTANSRLNRPKTSVETVSSTQLDTGLSNQPPLESESNEFTQQYPTTNIDQGAHTNSPQSSHVTAENISTSAAGSKRTKTRKKVSFQE